MSFGPTELLIVLAIVMLLFGASQLPKLARSMGEASKEFKKGVSGADKDDTVSAAKADDKVNLTNAQLEALLAEREAKAREETPPTA